jgi:alpha-1,2-mannosyltransferase
LKAIFFSVVAPGAGMAGDGSRSQELTNANATDSQSILAAVHAWKHPNSDLRPGQADGTTKVIHWAAALFFLAGTFCCALRAGRDVLSQMLIYGQFGALLVLVTPVSHMHYYAFLLPLVCGLWLKGIAGDSARVLPVRECLLPLVFWGILTSVPLFPGPEFLFLRQRGLGAAATAGLWAWTGYLILRSDAAASIIPMRVPERRAA